MVDLVDGGLYGRHQVPRRLVHLVYRELEEVVEHAGQQDAQQVAALLEARIRIHLNQEDVEVAVDEEIKAEKLEAVLPPIRIYLFAHLDHPITTVLAIASLMRESVGLQPGLKMALMP